MLQGKVIIITGGAGLLGREIAEAVCKNHAHLIIADNNSSKGNELAERLKSSVPGAIVDFSLVNICSKASVTNMIGSAFAKHGKIDALVNAAYPRNSHYGRKFEDVTFEDFTENVSLHLGGYFLVSQQIASFFKKQGWGNLINFASVYGFVAPRFEIYEGSTFSMPVEYAAIKAGVIHLSKYIAKYFKGCNIRVNCISPGGIFDRQNPAFLQKYGDYCLNKGMLDKNDLNGSLLFLLSEASRCVNGQNLVVDDGFSL